MQNYILNIPENLSRMVENVYHNAFLKKYGNKTTKFIRITPELENIHFSHIMLITYHKSP